MTTPATAILIRSNDAEVLPASGVTLLADTTATGGVLTTHRSVFMAGKDGAPPHRHDKATELFYVLSGALDVLTGDTIVTLHAGDLLVVPPGTPHAFAATADQDAEVLFVLTESSPRFDYYRLLEQVYTGQTDPAQLSATSDLYDNHYEESPIWQSR